ncbi:MAG TPA: hypothetical protein VF771_16680 [Longimicrobiaceae bacterium]
MRKMKLQLESLLVESFEAGAGNAAQRGTVRAHLKEAIAPDTDYRYCPSDSYCYTDDEAACYNTNWEACTNYGCAPATDIS